ncbi:uncharacterized protein LOC129590880 [Paramacrobiotus metropolitanus]|uniref:uncharacterized protein LOC129590880 n=1 Tax=Paramacrobiotus metropolitanus TaxID=2943436 RepID=UPI002445D914|nr:uncharacterized protein LOC129590880 [Paramacrobiotus metropolitanus]
MDNLLFLLLAGLLASCHGQYGTEEYDPVTGALLGECTFYGDYTTDCTGRLTCRPSDVEERPTTASLDRSCPKTPGTKSGKWDRDQSVIPANQISSDAGAGRLCKCQFYANHRTGNFKCTSVQGDTWKGTFSGSLNTAFRLGLPSSGFGTYQYVPDSGSGGRYRGTADDDTYGSSYNRYTTGSPYDRQRDRDTRYTTSSYDRFRDRDNYSGGRYSTGLDASRDRDPYYRDNEVGTGGTRDRYQTTYRGTDSNDRDSRYNSRTTSEVVMCTYNNDGKGSCRDCTERVERRELTTEIRTTKHYTCSGPDNKVSWPNTGGIIPRGVKADPYAYNKKVVATCVFRPDDGKRFECHGSSTDGDCAGTGTYGSSGFGSSSTGGANQRCIGGEKWTGTYSGNIY